MCVGAGIAVENILNIHQAGEHSTCFYLNCDGYSFYRITTNMKFILMYVCVEHAWCSSMSAVLNMQVQRVLTQLFLSGSFWLHNNKWYLPTKLCVTIFQKAYNLWYSLHWELSNPTLNYFCYNHVWCELVAFSDRRFVLGRILGSCSLKIL